MRRFPLLAALLGLAPGCSGSLELPYGSRVPVPDVPSGLPTPTPTPTPYVPSELPSDTGDGHDGPQAYTNPTPGVVNTCAPLTSAANSTITLSTSLPGISAGDRIFVWQVQDRFATVGDGAPATSVGGAGLFEFSRVNVVIGNELTLDTILLNQYDSANGRRAQVCIVPEFTDVSIGVNAVLAGPAWDGSSGGLVAFFASGTLTLDGQISAVGLGFRGGPRSNGNNGGNSNTNLITNNASGAGKGEGLDSQAFGTFGRGNYATGAGGGNTRNAGGGGGGNGGAGGLGGKQTLVEGDEPNTRGMPGSAFVPAELRVSMGGGGGGGHQNDGLLADGGRGGGLIIVIANVISGGGSLLSNGADGQSNGAGTTGDGAGGGGAGGTIVLLASQSSLFTGSLDVIGGNGGSINDSSDVQGPGGGGGGGRVLSNSSTAVLGANTDGGTCGTNLVVLDANGAANGADGVATLLN